MSRIIFRSGVVCILQELFLGRRGRLSLAHLKRHSAATLNSVDEVFQIPGNVTLRTVFQVLLCYVNGTIIIVDPVLGRFMRKVSFLGVFFCWRKPDASKGSFQMAGPCVLLTRPGRMILIVSNPVNSSGSIAMLRNGSSGISWANVLYVFFSSGSKGC